MNVRIVIEGRHGLPAQTFIHEAQRDVKEAFLQEEATPEYAARLAQRMLALLDGGAPSAAPLQSPAGPAASGSASDFIARTIAKVGGTPPELMPRLGCPIEVVKLPPLEQVCQACEGTGTQMDVKHRRTWTCVECNGRGVLPTGDGWAILHLIRQYGL